MEIHFLSLCTHFTLNFKWMSYWCQLLTDRAVVKWLYDLPTSHLYILLLYHHLLTLLGCGKERHRLAQAKAALSTGVVLDLRCSLLEMGRKTGMYEATQNKSLLLTGKFGLNQYWYKPYVWVLIQQLFYNVEIILICLWLLVIFKCSFHTLSCGHPHRQALIASTISRQTVFFCTLLCSEILSNTYLLQAFILK